MDGDGVAQLLGALKERSETTLATVLRIEQKVEQQGLTLAQQDGRLVRLEEAQEQAAVDRRAADAMFGARVMAAVSLLWNGILSWLTLRNHP